MKMKLLSLRGLMVAASLLTCSGLPLAANLIDAPLVLFPATPSIPNGAYGRSFDQAGVGLIASFAAPAAAERYYTDIGHSLPPATHFMKPLVAGPSDVVCNSLESGLSVNGRFLGVTYSENDDGHPLPLWVDCRPLADDEWFVFSDYARQSFDSRYYGPVSGNDIRGFYKPILFPQKLFF